MAQQTTWTKKDLTGIETLSRAEIEFLFDQAEKFLPALAPGKGLDLMHGRTVVNLFLEPSTRTCTAFEISAKKLGAEVVSINTTASSLVKGETLRDTAMNIRAMGVDAIVIRHSSAGAPRYLGEVLDISVINAGDGAHEHPTQALLDAFTLKQKFGKVEGLKVTILGDILFSRVARSNIHCLSKLGAQVTLAGPATLVPLSLAQAFPQVRIVHDLKTALSDADAVMLLRIQHERQTTTHFPSLAEYTSQFGLNAERAAWMKPNAVVMHPGPINRGVEVDSDVADGPRSVILEQVRNGVAVRMAVLHLCTSALKR
jgi:aspartate carbamoyltransferase catalytic subunit